MTRGSGINISENVWLPVGRCLTISEIDAYIFVTAARLSPTCWLQPMLLARFVVHRPDLTMHASELCFIVGMFLVVTLTVLSHGGPNS